MCRLWCVASSCVWLRCGWSSLPNIPPAVSCSTRAGSPLSLPCSSAGVIHTYTHLTHLATDSHTHWKSMWIFICPSNTITCCFFSIGGLILDKTVSDPNLAGIVVYTPVINGEICCSIQKYSIKLLLFVFLWNLWIVQHLSILENNSWRFGQYSA